jgi:hypothetical protein
MKNQGGAWKKKAEEMGTCKKRRANRGSSIIEISLLIPIFMGCIYLYIMLFLFFMESSKQMCAMSESIYSQESASLQSGFSLKTEGKMQVIRVKETGKLFEIEMELGRDGSEPLENIRRWQLVTSGI